MIMHVRRLVVEADALCGFPTNVFQNDKVRAELAISGKHEPVNALTLVRKVVFGVRLSRSEDRKVAEIGAYYLGFKSPFLSESHSWDVQDSCGDGVQLGEVEVPAGMRVHALERVIISRGTRILWEYTAFDPLFNQYQQLDDAIRALSWRPGNEIKAEIEHLKLLRFNLQRSRLDASLQFTRLTDTERAITKELRSDVAAIAELVRDAIDGYYKNPHV
jgi:uncharacterized protein YdcH (DUF465 family)